MITISSRIMSITTHEKPWKQCQLCPPKDGGTSGVVFSSPTAFADHLRLLHSQKEGGSHICKYGPNEICPLLPCEGVNDRDYETHIAKCHIFAVGGGGVSSRSSASTLNSTSSSTAAGVAGDQSSGSSGSDTSSRNHRSRYLNHHHHHKLFSTDFPSPSKLMVCEAYHLPAKQNDVKPNVIAEVTSGGEWTIYSSSQNLTSALNDPSKARSYYDNLFTKEWGAHFVEPNASTPLPFPYHNYGSSTLKKPSQVLFDAYVKKLKEIRRDGSRKQTALKRSNSVQQQKLLEFSKAQTSVPSLFFDDNFNLEDGETFLSLLSLFGRGGPSSNSASEDSSSLSSANHQDHKPSTTTSIDSVESFFEQRSMGEIQSLLSEYLDATEQDLAAQIGRRSGDFFQVMASMDRVMDRLKVAIRQVADIRASCEDLEAKLVRPIQRNIELTSLRCKYRDAAKKIQWIATVHQTQPTIQLLLSKNDYAGALDLISTSQEVVAQELSGVISFRHLKLQLMEIEKVIEQMMNQEFVKYLTAEWNRPLTDDTSNSSDHHQELQEERLLSIIYGMLKLQRFTFIDTFREEAFTAIKASVKQTVIETLSAEDSIEVSRGVNESGGSLYEQTRCLRFDRWLACLRTVFGRLGTLLKRVQLVYQVIHNGFVAVASSSSSQAQVQTPQPNGSSPASNAEVSSSSTSSRVILQSDYLELSGNLAEILASIVDFAHSRCAAIIELKVADGSLDRLEPAEFLALVTLIESFAADCEAAISRSRSNSPKSNGGSNRAPNLKLVIQLQSNKFVTRFHDERKRKLKQLLELEQWRAVGGGQLSEDFRRLVRELLLVKHHYNNSVSDTESEDSLVAIYERFKSGNNGKQQQNQQQSSKSSKSNSTTISTSSSSSNCLTVITTSNNQQQSFVLVNAVINLLYLMLEYAEVAATITFLSPDLLLRLVDLLKFFNSRTSQLVLGAEALTVAGLKTISARTLIISSRSLTFVMALVPRFRAHFEGLLNGSKQGNNQSMLKHFDELLELYENHLGKIPDKVIGLVKDVVASYLSKWVAKAPVPSASFQTISQHLVRLHDNIADIMPPEELVALFEKIHQTVISIFRGQLTKLKIANDGGPQHGLVTQELTFYTQSLRNLPSGIGKQLNLSTAELWTAATTTTTTVS